MLVSKAVNRNDISNEMGGAKWVFPIGVILTIGGVALYALVEHLSFGNTSNWEYEILSQMFLPALFLGTGTAIAGSVIDRRRLPSREARIRGLWCLLGSGVSLLFLANIGNVHSWTESFIFPIFVGFVTGVILLSAPSAEPDE